jgi:hypothetical protein
MYSGTKPLILWVEVVQQFEAHNDGDGLRLWCEQS